MKKVLIICAHPDDDILGCGGIMSKYSEKGVEFRVVFIAEGSSCRFKSGEIDTDDVRQVINDRNNCGVTALKSLGVENYKMYNLPCGRLDTVPLLEINKIIENEINEFRPDTIFSHSEYDANNDHRIVFRSLIISTRPVKKTNTVKAVYSFEILSSTEWNFTNPFEPNFFEELSYEDINKKWLALAAYETEIKDYPFPRSYDGIETLAKFRGMQAGVHFAEAFKLIRKINIL